MKHDQVIFEDKQQRLLDKCIALFGCVPGNYQIEAISTNKIVAIKFDKSTVTQMLQNAPHTRNKFHKMLCKQLAAVSAVAKCNDTDQFDESRGLRLAKLRFIRKVANITMGCYKQLHADMVHKFQQTKASIDSSVEKITKAIDKFNID